VESVLEVETRTHTIAVIDDDPAMRKALARLLAVFGCRVELFESAAEFINAAEATEAQCLIVDIVLGETSGLDLARQLAAAGFKFPIIFVTGADVGSVRQQCMDFGCVAFLEKPILEHRLVAGLKKAIGPDFRPV